VTFVCGLLGINLLDFVIEFRVFASLTLCCCLGKNLKTNKHEYKTNKHKHINKHEGIAGTILFSSVSRKAHILVSAIPFLVVLSLLVILAIVLLFDLKQIETFWWYLAMGSYLMEFALQGIFISIYYH